MIEVSLIPDHPHPMECSVRLTAPRTGVVVELNKQGNWLVLAEQRISMDSNKLREVLATWFVLAEQRFAPQISTNDLQKGPRNDQNS